jgi:hypothetical protein
MQSNFGRELYVACDNATSKVDSLPTPSNKNAGS